ncbi:MAG TPA: hypothetical protein VHW01_16450 [Polyangiaceae bacterium]|jgi:hypothetical protein|nr:hypothetical protein [Polyangiaceae bacterium]
MDYALPAVEPCSDLDPPADALAGSPGLTATEYSTLLRGADGNFFDDGTWWLKAAPRGESHVEPLEIVAEDCEHVNFASFDYDYASATPALGSAPECGQYLVGMQAGHRSDDSWPQLLSIEGSGLVRLAPLRAATVFGSYLRLLSDLPGDVSRQSRVTRLEVIGHDDATLELVALGEGPTFTVAMRLTLTPGDATQLGVELELFLRSGGSPPADLSLTAVTGTFQVGADDFDFDQITASFSDGTSRTTALSDPNLDLRDGASSKISSTKSGASLSSFALAQGSRASQGDAGAAGDIGERPDMTVSEIHSDVPLALELSLASGPVPGGNVAASLVLAAADASTAVGPIHVSYVVTASLP